MTIIELYNMLKIEIDNGHGDNIACEVSGDGYFYEIRSVLHANSITAGIECDNMTLISSYEPNKNY